MTVNELMALWDYSDPAESERRFRLAYDGMTDDWRDLCLIQAARTLGLREDFDGARAVLAGLESRRDSQPVLVQAAWWLERGRTFASSAHRPAQITSDAREEARRCYQTSLRLAQEHGLDSLAVDALHMMVIVDPDPSDQLAWNQQALEVVQGSVDPGVKSWLGPLHNNIGYALHLAGEYDEALDHFGRSRQAYLERNDAAAARIADWMIAWTYRVMGRADEALAAQLRNEQANAAADTPDFYVFDELETLYTSRGDLVLAARYQALKEQHPA